MLIGRSIQLKPIEPADGPLLAQWFSDPDYLGEFFNVWAETPVEWGRTIDRSRERSEEGVFLIVLRKEQRPIGAMGYYDPFKIDIYQGREIWYQIHPDARGHGYATQATCVLINHLFSAIPINRIEATTVVGNESSSRVLENAGMLREGTRRGLTFLHGEHQDMNMYGITRTDWGSVEQYRKGRDFFRE